MPSGNIGRPKIQSGGQVDVFVKITGTVQGFIKGESTDVKHPGEIEADWFSWEVIQPTSKHSGGLGAGKREHGMFKFLMRSQTATPRLLTACCTGEHLKEVLITCRKAGTEQQDFMKWKLTNALVTKVETGCLVPGEIVPFDEISFAFHRIQLEYREQKKDGTLGGAVSFSDDWSA